jgi:hypothetical protein
MLFVELLEASPKMVDNRLDLLSTVADAIFKMMLQVEVDVDESWLRPREGFQDKDGKLTEEEGVEIDYVKLGRK